jgi:hypothetical protein
MLASRDESRPLGLVNSSMWELVARSKCDGIDSVMLVLAPGLWQIS